MIREENGTLIKFLGNKPKYSIFENERRWLVGPDFIKELESKPHYQVIDKYLEQSRMRIRYARDSRNGEVIYKLCKKYGPHTPLSEPITTIYLSKEEYESLFSLPGKIIRKTRYEFEENGVVFHIDSFIEPKIDYLIAEVERSSVEELEALSSPSFSVREITEDREYSGGYLALMTKKI